MAFSVFIKLDSHLNSELMLTGLLSSATNDHSKYSLEDDLKHALHYDKKTSERKTNRAVMFYEIIVSTVKVRIS